MLTRLVAVDSGKSDTKVCALLNGNGSVVKRSFPTRVIDRNNRDCLEAINNTGGTGFIVEYDGKVYAVGDIANSDDSLTSNQNSKNDQIHKITTLTAIACSVNNDDNVCAAIGCPIEIYPNKENRERYLNNILPSGRVDIKINGVEKRFIIVKKMVIPEAMGILYTNPVLFKDKLVGIIDIGGLNVNTAVVNDLKLLADKCFTNKLGRRSIENELRKYVEDIYESSFSAAEIDIYIRQGYVTDSIDPVKEKKSGEFISGVLDEHFVSILKDCSRHEWNLRNMDLVFVGGGSIIFKDRIRLAFPKAIIAEDANYANVEGFLAKLRFTEQV